MSAGSGNSGVSEAATLELVNYADGVDGHYCIGRKSGIFMEFWNPIGWAGSGYLFTEKSLADAVIALLAALSRMLNSFAGDLCMECGEVSGTHKTCESCYVIGKAIEAIEKAVQK